MAVATITYTNIRQGVDVDGKRAVYATVNFSVPGTDTYTTNGVPLNMLDLGLRSISAVQEEKTRTVDTSLLTFAGWKTSQSTTTFSLFVDIATNGTPEAPLVTLWSAGAEKAASAIPASWSGAVRLKFIGTA